MAKPSSERVSKAVSRRAGIRRAQLGGRAGVQQARASGGDVRAARQSARAGVQSARAVPGAGLGNMSLGALRGAQARQGMPGGAPGGMNMERPGFRPGLPGAMNAGIGTSIAQRAIAGGGLAGNRPPAGMMGNSLMQMPGAFARISPTWQNLGGAMPSSPSSLPQHMRGGANSGYFNPASYGGAGAGYAGQSPMTGKMNMEPGGYGTPSMGSRRAVPGAVGY